MGNYMQELYGGKESMKPNKRYTKRMYGLTISLIIVSAFFLANRFLYGVWSPLEPPERVICFGRSYHPSALPAERITGDKHLASWAHLLTGKRIYLPESREQYVPTVIYVHYGDDTYKAYSLSGGP